MIALVSPSDVALASVLLTCIGFHLLDLAEWEYPYALIHELHPRMIQRQLLLSQQTEMSAVGRGCVKTQNQKRQVGIILYIYLFQSLMWGLYT